MTGGPTLGGYLVCAIMTIALVLIFANSNRGACVKTRHVAEHRYYTVKPPMWRTIPAHDVCVQYERKR